MIKNSEFVEELIKKEIMFYSGVPDTILKDFISVLSDNKKIIHIPSTSETEAISLCAGYYLASQKITAVYLQNSGLGNIIDPLTSLLNKEVYSIPLLLIISLRGGKKTGDAIQHYKMGKITLPMLECLKIPYSVMGKKYKTEINKAVNYIKTNSLPYAIIIKKSFFNKEKERNQTRKGLMRKNAINCIINKLKGKEVLVSTTGKTSRELFELKKKTKKVVPAFYNIGAMGCCSAIATGIALRKPKIKVFVLDGDGSALMHLGNLATIGNLKQKNLFHFIFNNNSYESTGSQPCVSETVNFAGIAKSVNYKSAFLIENKRELKKVLDKILKKNLIGPVLITIKTKNASKKNLKRIKKLSKTKKSLIEWLNDN